MKNTIFPSSIKAGLSSYSFTWAIGVPGKMPDKVMTAFDLLKTAADLHADCVQIADNLPLHLLPDEELKSLADISVKLQLPVEVGTRGIQPDNFNRYLDIASFFKSSILRIVLGSKDFNPSLDEVNGIIRDFIPELEKRKITLAIENYEKFSVHDFVDIVEKASSDYVGICLDTVNSMGRGEGLEQVIGYLAPLTVNLHVKEFIVRRIDHQMGFAIEGVPLGKGILPLQKILERVPAICRSAILEQWVPPETTLEKTIEKESDWADESFDFLKNILYNKTK